MKLARLERALDLLDHALVIVDEAGSVHYRNRLAGAMLKSAGSPLTLGAGILAARGRELQTELQAAIRLACLQRRSSAHVSSGCAPRRRSRGAAARRRWGCCACCSATGR